MSIKRTRSGQNFSEPRLVMNTRRIAIWTQFFLAVPRLLLLAQTPANFKIAFIGDQGRGKNAQAVLHLIKNEGAAAVVHSGDFDYQDNPAAWDDQINAILGADFPYFASLGNHDDGSFYGESGYQSFLIARLNRLGITWDGRSEERRVGKECRLRW